MGKREEGARESWVYVAVTYGILGLYIRVVRDLAPSVVSGVLRFPKVPNGENP